MMLASHGPGKLPNSGALPRASRKAARQLLYCRVFKRQIHGFKHLMNDRHFDNRWMFAKPGVVVATPSIAHGSAA